MNLDMAIGILLALAAVGVGVVIGAVLAWLREPKSGPGWGLGDERPEPLPDDPLNLVPDYPPAEWVSEYGQGREAA